MVRALELNGPEGGGESANVLDYPADWNVPERPLSAELICLLKAILRTGEGQ
jgi:hypothetical protein